MASAENVILIALFFALLMALFGIGQSSPQNLQNTFNQLLSPPPTFAGAFTLKNCSWNLDPSCFGSNVAEATGAVAVAISYPAIFVFWFFNKIGLFFGFISTAILGPSQASNGTPFIALVFGFLFIYVLFEVMRIFRGNSTAGV